MTRADLQHAAGGECDAHDAVLGHGGACGARDGHRDERAAVHAEHEVTGAQLGDGALALGSGPARVGPVAAEDGVGEDASSCIRRPDARRERIRDGVGVGRTAVGGAANAARRQPACRGSAVASPVIERSPRCLVVVVCPSRRFPFSVFAVAVAAKRRKRLKPRGFRRRFPRAVFLSSYWRRGPPLRGGLLPPCCIATRERRRAKRGATRKDSREQRDDAARTERRGREARSVERSRNEREPHDDHHDDADPRSERRGRENTSTGRRTTKTAPEASHRPTAPRRRTTPAQRLTDGLSGHEWPTPDERRSIRDAADITTPGWVGARLAHAANAEEVVRTSGEDRHRAARASPTSRPDPRSPARRARVRPRRGTKTKDAQPSRSRTPTSRRTTHASPGLAHSQLAEGPWVS